MLNLVERVLKDMGISIISTAQNGKDGLEHMKRARRSVDIVICDLEMPVMNGLQFVEAIRSGREKIDPTIPILVLTGNAEEETVHTAVQLGVDGYVVKPVSRTALEKRMESALRSKNRI